jgi:hypothetical protein
MKKVSVLVSDLKIALEDLGKKEVTIIDILAVINKLDSQAKEKSDEIILVVDYSRTFQKMIDAGNYGWVNDYIIEKNFPIPEKLKIKKAEISTKLFHFNYNISSKDLITEMDKTGYRPGTLLELLALGESHPELQKEFTIVALGSIWRDTRDRFGVPALSFVGNRRGLFLFWISRGFFNDYRFLGVYK